MNLHIKTLENDARRRRAAHASILMCAPHHFGVDYIINPWMENQIGRTDVSRARDQWDNLRRHLSGCANLAFVTAESGLPDMVFTANAGLVLDGVAVVSRFHAKERRPEEGLFRQWFDRQGFEIAAWPEDVAFEGAGDALPDRARRLIWCGHGWRSSDLAPRLIETIFDWRTVGLKLVDPRFYHLDTCFCPLPDGSLMYYPAAFDEASLAAIRAVAPAEKRIEVSETDALGFACNAVEVSGRIFLNACSDALKTRLAAAGFAPIVTPLSEFLKAGGAAKCLTLELNGGALS
ncbi:arginine deiminase-related protein [Methylocystis echinoides]|jgi:N-dimethylarginine dimethylaminohydrolase|uniref:dimethylarginine dimethylaminohydrolase family protein n=1 Tax=Methylocystis echinoides TaxID=29468 RepID=UPI00343F83A0